ncbi:hypothetical protein O181_034095 [Austropuccinia psidii MF-1]|uniref:CCHC-type domain-containing protein n=1 Tax=Austropuccinia psidii MF-1 TaxID=1389203 RepID=A0A9Q3H9U7_9BASI|nr:hypothetical protein [Austropuccinia psidii MF-1]
MAYTSGPPQCFNCLKTGHEAFQCKEKPTCTKCGGTHQSQDCKNLSYIPSIRRCVKCINQEKSTNQQVDLYDEKYRHSAFSQKCPICQREIQDLTPQPRINEWSTETFHPNPNQDFLFFQLNCHDRYDSTISVLNSELTYTALLLQEPWGNPHNWLPPTHQNWHRITPTPNPRNPKPAFNQQADPISPNHQPTTRKQLTDHNNTTGCIQLNPPTHSTVLV